jgi:hypothetical protein
MAKDIEKRQLSKVGVSLTSGANVRRGMAAAYLQRLTMPEALEAVGKMLMAYPNARDGLRDGYVGVIAALLTRYPRQVALRCADPIDGVTRDCKFLPTVAEAVQWLEREQQPFKNAHGWEEQSITQLAERDKFERQGREGKEADPAYRAQVVQRIKNEIRAHGFKFAEDKISHNETPMTVMAKYNLTQEQWDSSPKAPKSKDYWQGVRWPND